MLNFYPADKAELKSLLKFLRNLNSFNLHIEENY